MKGNKVNMKKTIKTMLVIYMCVLFTGCATVERSTIHSKSSYDSVWQACIISLPDVKYAATSTDRKSNLIIAQQSSILGSDTIARLNIIVNKTANGVSVNVAFIPQPGSFGGNGVVAEYIKALKTRIPDIEVLSTE